MQIFLNILFLVIGMVLLIKGADFFVSGASSIAKKCKIPAMFIGLTIVALGTSLPELSVSLASAFKHSVDMSVGNIVGSNMMNMLLILGIVVLIRPIPVQKSSKKIDFPFLIGITLLLLLFCADMILNGGTSNIITRTESIILLAALVIYITLLVLNAKKERSQCNYQISQPLKDKVEEDRKAWLKNIDTNVDKIANTNKENDYIKNQSKLTKKAKRKKKSSEDKVLKVWQIVLCIVFGLGAVIFGAECVSSTAQFLALKLGMSEALVGLTVVTIGTSLPELATSIAASVKGENQMALGNIIGSNVINIALILGAVGVVTQINVSNTILIDMLILTVCTIIFSVVCMCRKDISRVWGAIFICMYVAYITFAIVRNYCFPTWLT